MRNEGITILQIVITIMIMIILASVAIFYVRGIPKEANLVNILNETKEIESALKEAYLLNKAKVVGDSLELYGEVTLPKVDNTEYKDIIGEDVSGNYYYLDFTSSKSLRNTLELEKVKNDYLLDWDNMNIYIVDGVDIISGDISIILYDSNDIDFYYKNVFKK